MSFRFLVQLSDHCDFGDENNDKVAAFSAKGDAAFSAKGDAVAYAIELRRRTNRAARVMDTKSRRNPKEVFRANPEEVESVA